MLLCIQTFQTPAHAFSSNRLPEEDGFSLQVSGIAIPASFAAVTKEAFFNPSKKSKTVIIVQDAHGIGQAQMSLMNGILHLTRKYRIGLVAVEGAEGRLDPLLLKAFPDKEILRAHIYSQLERGEISGAAAASVFDSDEVIYSAVESHEEYVRTIDAYLETMNRRPYFQEKFSRIKLRVQALQSEFLAPGLGKLLNVMFDPNHNIKEELEEVKANAGDGLFLMLLKDYPSLEAFYKAVKEEGRPSPEIKSQIQSLSESLRQAAPEDAQFQSELSEQYRGFLTDEERAPEFALFLVDHALRQRTGILISAELKSFAQSHRRLREIDVPAFQAERERFMQEVKKRLFAGRAEKVILALRERASAAERAWALKLTRTEWDLIKGDIFENGSLFLDEVRGNDRIAAIAADLSELLDKNSPWFSFYRYAEARDEILGGRTLEEMERSGSKTAILVAGGFHADGISRFLEKKGINYAVLVPFFDGDEKTHYESVMKGDLTWKSFFKIDRGFTDLYEAYMKSAAARLDNEMHSRQPHLYDYYRAEWQKTVMKELIRKKRENEILRYLGFLERRGMTDITARRKIDRFLTRLSSLKNEGNLTAENIMQVSAAGAMQWSAAGSFVRGPRMPASWLEGKPSRNMHPAVGKGSVSSVFDETQAEPVRSELRHGNPAITDLSRAYYLDAGLKGLPREDARATFVNMGDVRIEAAVWNKRTAESFTREDYEIFKDETRDHSLQSFLRSGGKLRNIRQSIYDRSSGEIQIRMVLRDDLGRSYHVNMKGSDTNAMDPLKELMPQADSWFKPGAALIISAGNQADLRGNWILKGSQDGWRLFSAADEPWNQKIYYAFVEFKGGERKPGHVILKGNRGRAHVKHAFFREAGGKVYRPLDYRETEFVLAAYPLLFGQEDRRELLQKHYDNASDLRHIFAFPYMDGKPLFYADLASAGEPSLAKAYQRAPLAFRLDESMQNRIEELTAVLDRYGYKKKKEMAQVKRRGDYFLRNGEITLIFHPAVYPVNVLALSRDGRHTAQVVIEGRSGQLGADYHEAGRWIRKQIKRRFGWDAYAVFALDNGLDPYSRIYNAEGKGITLVKSRRERFNAGLVFFSADPSAKGSFLSPSVLRALKPRSILPAFGRSELRADSFAAEMTEERRRYRSERGMWINIRNFSSAILIASSGAVSWYLSHPPVDWSAVSLGAGAFIGSFTAYRLARHGLRENEAHFKNELRYLTTQRLSELFQKKLDKYDELQEFVRRPLVWPLGTYERTFDRYFFSYLRAISAYDDFLFGVPDSFDKEVMRRLLAGRREEHIQSFPLLKQAVDLRRKAILRNYRGKERSQLLHEVREASSHLDSVSAMIALAEHRLERSELREKTYLPLNDERFVEGIPFAIKYLELFLEFYNYEATGAKGKRPLYEDHTGMERLWLVADEGEGSVTLRKISSLPPGDQIWEEEEKTILIGDRHGNRAYETDHPVILEWEGKNPTAVYIGLDAQGGMNLKLEILRKRPRRAEEAFDLAPFLFDYELRGFLAQPNSMAKILPLNEVIARASLVPGPVKMEGRRPLVVQNGFLGTNPFIPLMSALNKTDFDPDEIMDAMARHPRIQQAFDGIAVRGRAGNPDLYLRTHIRNILLLFKTYFSQRPLPDGMPAAEFLFLLAAHDLAKTELLSAQGSSDSHHEPTLRLIDEIFRPYLPLNYERLYSLTRADPIGRFFQGKIHVDEAAGMILDMYAGSGIPLEAFLDLLTIYYQLDAASYTLEGGWLFDASVLFKVSEGTFSTGPRGLLAFSGEADRLYQGLIVRVRELAYESRPAAERSEMRLAEKLSGAHTARTAAQAAAYLAAGRPFSHRLAAAVRTAAERDFPSLESLIKKGFQRRRGRLSQAYENERQALRSVREFKEGHADYENRKIAFQTHMLSAFAARFEKAMEFSDRAPLHLSFVYKVPEPESAQRQLLNYLEWIADLKRRFPQKITFGIKLIASKNQTEEPFFRSLEKYAAGLGVRTLYWESPAITNQIEEFLEENPNALVYGLPPALLKAKFMLRYVESGVPQEDVFLAAVLLTQKLAGMRRSGITPSEIRQLSHSLPEVLRFNGTHLTITDSVLSLIYDYEVSELIARMA